MLPPAPELYKKYFCLEEGSWGLLSQQSLGLGKGTCGLCPGWEALTCPSVGRTAMSRMHCDLAEGLWQWSPTAPSLGRGPLLVGHLMVQRGQLLPDGGVGVRVCVGGGQGGGRSNRHRHLLGSKPSKGSTESRTITFCLLEREHFRGDEGEGDTSGEPPSLCPQGRHRVGVGAAFMS